MAQLNTTLPVERLTLDHVIKRYFKYPLLVTTDVHLLLKVYKNLKTSLDQRRNTPRLNIRGSIPYLHRNMVYYCPIRIQLGFQYPYSAPSINVVSTEHIKIVDKHPIIATNGEIRLQYLDEWTQKSTLAEALRLVQEAFNKDTPIYTVSGTGDTSCGNASNHLTDLQSKSTHRSLGHPSPRDRSANHGADAEVSTGTNNLGGVSLHPQYSVIMRNIEVKVAQDKDDLIKAYNGDSRKYDVHRLSMAQWVPTCFDIGEALKSQSIAKSVLESALKREEDEIRDLENVDKYFSEVLETANAMKELQKTTDGVALEELPPIENVVNFSDKVDKELCDAIASEAAADAMLELLQATLKRKKISTKEYIKYVRMICHDKFYGMHKRMSTSLPT